MFVNRPGGAGDVLHKVGRGRMELLQMQMQILGPINPIGSQTMAALPTGVVE